mgnify:CR=1 FL=1
MRQGPQLQYPFASLLRAGATLAGQLLGFPLEPKETFNIPFASYTFPHNRVGWETVAPLMERACCWDNCSSLRFS